MRIQDVGLLAGAEDPGVLDRAARERRMLLARDAATITHYAHARVSEGTLPRARAAVWATQRAPGRFPGRAPCREYSFGRSGGFAVDPLTPTSRAGRRTGSSSPPRGALEAGPTPSNDYHAQEAPTAPAMKASLPAAACARPRPQARRPGRGWRGGLASRKGPPSRRIRYETLARLKLGCPYSILAARPPTARKFDRRKLWVSPMAEPCLPVGEPGSSRRDLL